MKRRLRLAAGLACAAAIAAWATPAALSAVKPQAEVAGTVFDQNGFGVADCDVVVTNLATKKHWESETNPVGEFEVWVPAGKADYSVRAQAPHYQPGEAQVQIQNKEKVTIFLHVKKAQP